MSSALAIAAVTAVLKDLLDNGLVDRTPVGVGSVVVNALPPDLVPKGDTVPSQLNLFLYNVIPNVGWRNVGLPSRDPTGDRTSNPPLAIDLHYLLSAYGKENFHSEILLGYAMQILHETPVLTRESVRLALNPPLSVNGIGTLTLLQSLSTAGLDEQIEQIKICPQSLNTEEISRLWAAFQSPYRPTAAYQVSVVLIESRRSTRSPLSVRRSNLRVVTRNQIVITTLLPTTVTTGTTLRIQGYNLNSDRVRVSFGVTVVDPLSVGSQQIEVNLPAGLQAGVNTVQVLHDIDFGTPFEPHRGFESNIMPFVLHPRITGPITAAASAIVGAPPGAIAVTIPVQPAVNPSQRVVLLLNERNGSAAYSFTAARRESATNAITVTINGVKAADYLVRLQVDGAESLPDVDPIVGSPTYNQYTGTPSVPLPCVGNCLRPVAIALSPLPPGDPVTVSAQITVQSEAGAVVQGATVSIVWILPDGTPRSDSGTTDATGIVSFTIAGSRGTYQFTVINIAKLDFSFDPRPPSVLTASVSG
ncbi:MAG: DUF4255 domain-containing protein [Leptolyngbyaceae cyanobacterium RU_5_1]|nr:DUF4255 domain-containing protein [Leptolyngbyaceae cyanobacterium RU_5_1]